MTNLVAPGRISGRGVAVIFSAVLLLWALAPVVVAYFYPDLAHRGQVGDLFGSVNALFSGLAFAGVIIAILLQSEELELQRHEIAANRAELARAATAQEESREALQKTIYAQAFKTATDILQAETVRQTRRVVLSELPDKPLSAWTDAQRSAAAAVCHTYVSVGIMVRHDMLPVNYIADSWGDSLRRTWGIWDDNEYLAREKLSPRRPHRL